LCFAGPSVRAQLLSLDLGLSLGGSEESGILGDIDGVVSDAVEGLGNIVEDAIGGGGGGGVPNGAVVEHPAALGAIADQRAIPLDQLMRIVTQTAVGQVVDVRMIVVQQILLYEVKLITAGGVVSNLYFIAQNGQQVLVR
jgi:hypothetical protein